ncbi:MAG TPA: GNAT family N-acetyltransferase [Methanobacteriaceae archaeon]|nr:GNAT family N-acetyltransferase [Methanobacteriaceae archaeon]
MIIKLATVSDAREILALQRLAYQSEAELYQDYTIKPLIQTLDEMKKDFESYTFLKAVDNGKIVGSVRGKLLDPQTCYIGRLSVHPDYQNQGLGKRLMEQIERVFKPCQRFELFTGHLSQKNIHIYQKLGYSVYETKKLNDHINLVYLEKI